MERTYIAIDLKSFYASVECVERHLDPLTTNLVVADSSRTEKTICLAVSPSLKAHGISGRARLFEVVQRVKEVNSQRKSDAIRKGLIHRNESGQFEMRGPSFDAQALALDPSLELAYITATPQMRKYMEYSSRIYQVYLKYIAPEDIHVYSIDEVFIDVTGYLSLYHMTARELCKTMIRDVLYTTGITATGGIGTNLYLCKVAMDIVAKHVPADRDGVRIAELNERTYRQTLWAHKPITDFWRVGSGIAKKLKAHGMETMGDVARCSIGGPDEFFNEDLLYKLFGINAELLIDHAWGYEPTTIDLIKQYRPSTNSVSSGQVLHQPYDYDYCRIIVREMADSLVLDLVGKGLVTNQLVLTIGYDKENLQGDRGKRYTGPVVSDHYGRKIPKHAHGTENLPFPCSSTAIIVEAVLKLYDRIMDRDLLARRVTISANNLVPEDRAELKQPDYTQLDLFTDFEAEERRLEAQRQTLETEKQLQKALLKIQHRYGKNAILKGTNYQEGATMIDRNGQVGGHKG